MTENLTKKAFLEKVFNYEQHKEWKFEGDKLCCIDFHGNSCGLCQTMPTFVDLISEEYNLLELELQTIQLEKETFDLKLQKLGLLGIN